MAQHIHQALLDREPQRHRGLLVEPGQDVHITGALHLEPQHPCLGDRREQRASLPSLEDVAVNLGLRFGEPFLADQDLQVPLDLPAQVRVEGIVGRTGDRSQMTQHRVVQKGGCLHLHAVAHLPELFVARRTMQHRLGASGTTPAQAADNEYCRGDSERQERGDIELPALSGDEKGRPRRELGSEVPGGTPRQSRDDMRRRATDHHECDLGKGESESVAFEDRGDLRVERHDKPEGAGRTDHEVGDRIERVPGASAQVQEQQHRADRHHRRPEHGRGAGELEGGRCHQGGGEGRVGDGVERSTKGPADGA